ncbi:MAG TPA: hypothetical protein VFB45_06420 [Pseudolabrys sp.]|nr:hypothetical protein [Pseudolabrys sp.]
MPRAEIATKQAKFTLDTLHAELAGKLEAAQEEAGRVREAMHHVEAVLKLLDPSYSLRKISLRRKNKNALFKRGTFNRHVLTILRSVNAPLTTREVTDRMLAAKGVVEPGQVTLRNTFGSVACALSRFHKSGVVQRAGEGSPKRWRLTTPSA